MDPVVGGYEIHCSEAPLEPSQIFGPLEGDERSSGRGDHEDRIAGVHVLPTVHSGEGCERVYGAEAPVGGSRERNDMYPLSKLIIFGDGDGDLDAVLDLGNVRPLEDVPAS